MMVTNGYTLVGYNTEHGKRFPVFRNDEGDYVTYDADNPDSGEMAPCCHENGSWQDWEYEK